MKSSDEIRVVALITLFMTDYFHTLGTEVRQLLAPCGG